MSETSLGGPADWSLTPAGDAVCDRFEAAWKSGARPSIEEYLGNVPEPERRPLLGELLKLELDYRRQMGEEPAKAEYEARFPEALDLLDEVFRDRTSGFTRPNSIASAKTLPPGEPAAELPAVPGYETLEKLGGGGMGVVYKARQLARDRIVALKMIRSGDPSESEELKRFHIETKAIALLDHPNVLRIYEFGDYNGHPYYSMEFAEGGSLAQALGGQPLPPVRAAELVELLARAMHTVHQHKIIHRDLKPANILLQNAACSAPDDQRMPHIQSGPPSSGFGPGLEIGDRGLVIAKIADFGLAKMLEGSGAGTVSGRGMGTPGYVAPEQIEGRSQAIGPAVDIYGLGAILYETLTGRPPFQAPRPELAFIKALEEDPQPPSQLRPDVPADLEAVCLRCLEREPAGRYACAGDLAEDLRRFRAGEPTVSRPLPEWERQARWARGAGFEVDEVLTYGVRDIVYKAKQVHLNRIVALKVIATPEEAGLAARNRLAREAETLARLDHANIVRIYSSGEHHGRTYLAYEFVEGKTLSERCVEKPMPARDAARLTKVLAQAIEYAHQAKILHGALKPTSILLTGDGTPKITNFGLSTAHENEDEQRWIARQRLPTYEAPELIARRPEAFSPATDVYSLGANLYFMLTGEPPFLANTVQETLDFVRNQAPVPPSQRQPEVAATLDAICLKCLEKDPRHRYASAAEISQELTRFLNRQPTKTDVVELIPGYELLEELGRGGTGIVHKALQLNLKRPVALKIFHERRPSFLAANQAVAGIHHPNLVAVFDCGERDNRFYVAEELVEGGTLDQRLAGHAQPPTEAARLVETLARAMHQVHLRGLIHANLKPRVVLLDALGTPKIGSFDLAKFLEKGTTEVAEPGQLAGTPKYMAPEQLAGANDRIGPATDIYALGLILYELLTARSPFPAVNAVEYMRQVQTLEPLPARQHQPGVSRDLDAICGKCLCKDPAHRYASALALAEDLRRFHEGRVTEARPVGVGERVVYWLRRRVRDLPSE